MTDGYLLLIVQDIGSYTVQTLFFFSLCASLVYSSNTTIRETVMFLS